MMMLFAFVVAGTCFSGCEKDTGESDKTAKMSMSDKIVGNYVGTLKPVGYTDEPAPAYVTLGRRSSSVVSFSMTCETFGWSESAPINLKIEDQQGLYYLSSESDYSINGSWSNNTLTITLEDASEDKWYFVGRKD